MLDKLRQQKESLLGNPPPSSSPSTGTSASSGVEKCVEKYCGCHVTLSWKERMLGWSFCFGLGFIISFGSTLRLMKLLHGNPAPFALMYSIGNILSLFSTAFFVGPWKQLRSMFHEKRRFSAIFYIVFIIITLVLCFSPHVPVRLALVVVSILCQFSALVWYSLSYIPYGRAIFRSCLLRSIGCHSADDESLV